MKEILELLEERPTDEDTLDEIDARVWCLKMGYEYSRLNKANATWRRFVYYKLGPYKDDRERLTNTVTLPRSYTRSRDALLTLRVNGWILQIIGQQDGTWKVSAMSKRGFISGEGFASEQLAELHTALTIMAAEEF